MTTGVLDTSVFVARASGRPLGALPEAGMVSVISLAELRVGVLVAAEPSVRAQRMHTLRELETLEPLPVDDDVAGAFAEIVADCKARGKKPKVLDALIASTAIARRVPVYTQDADFEDMRGVEVVRV